ncbi:hypothetical protein HPATCC43504_00472 [Helicobacter pylori]|uniref:Uncharacterized protein n=1 Tax=Helicobacter pylori TaxID=210 RepID=A0AAD1DAG6_HELPX|nr:hypothetical protein HPATCC43504_00472 [Helicobacter pylori]SQJ03784.1 Uncharacterised protein [Helicobacter pylori NCTC 11637 = CCUG 17874 = ATCC 43504 = JCM 12093]
MNALKKLSFCALLSLGLFAQTAHAKHLKGTINYPDWLEINLFDKKNPPNQYVGSASISGKRNDFYANYIPYDDQLPTETNAEKNRSFKGQNERLQHFRKRNHYKNAQSHC